MKYNIGFIQGRLSPIYNGQIQCFPWKSWEAEFQLAKKGGFEVMEWTLDQENLYQNPFMTKNGQEKIKKLKEDFNLSIPSLTGDCFMQAPFWKKNGEEREKLERDFLAIVDACSELNTTYIVVPLVDNGKIENSLQEEILLKFFIRNEPYLKKKRVKIIFESDLAPNDLLMFINKLSLDSFGINYDIGNSASLGYNCEDEFKAYGHRILNIHIKDRVLGGTTVYLGEGNADFPKVFSLIKESGYTGNYILQTARSKEDDHLDLLMKFKKMAESWLV